MENQEARAIQLQEYLKVYRHETAVAAVEALEARLVAQGSSLADYVAGQQEIQARIRAWDAENEPARVELRTKAIERIRAVESIADPATRRKAVEMLRAELSKDYWQTLLTRSEDLTEQQRDIVGFIRGETNGISQVQ